MSALLTNLSHPNRSSGGAALVAATPVFVPRRGSMLAACSVRAAGEVRASARAVALPCPMLTDGQERRAAVSTGLRHSRPTPVPGSIIPIGVTATTGWDEVLRPIVGGVAIEVVSADRFPSQFVRTPMTNGRSSGEFVVQHDPADECLPVPACEWMVWHVTARPRGFHGSHSSSAWRTTDPGERARAMRVPRPERPVDGQQELFGGVA